MRLPAAFTLLLTLGTLAGFARAASTTQSPVPDTLQRLIAHNQGHGGGVVRISGPDGLLITASDGHLAGPESPLMTADTPFEVASITKAVTAASILRLVEQGKITLDTTLGEALPKETGFARTITIRQLLSHTSGLSDYWTDGRKDREGNNAFLGAFLAAPQHSWAPVEILSYARDLPGRRENRFHYSDTNYVLLGLIIERLTGQPLHRAYRDLIFEPLGMRGTWLTYKESRRGDVQSHRYEGSEDLTDVPRQSADWAGGGLVSTARDLERFLRGLASGQLFRQAETLETMREAVPVGEEGITYGLGLYRVDLGDGQGELWGHDGHGNSFAYYWPERGITFTGTLNQTDNDWWPLIEAYTENKTPEIDFSENDRSFEISLSTGWDSLYMDRGVNALRERGYGSGIYWTDLNFSWAITDNDILTLEAWYALATQSPAYRELDASIAYTRLLGSFSLTFGYMMSYGYADGNYYSHELSGTIDYTWKLGAATITPSITGLFNLGPDIDDGEGLAPAGSGYLLLRVDGHVPVYRQIVALEPWTAFGVNFGYNTRNAPIDDDAPAPFTGANNIEFGLAVPVRLTSSITLTPYGAYSHALTDLYSTAPNTFWGGVSLMFTY